MPRFSPNKRFVIMIIFIVIALAIIILLFSLNSSKKNRDLGEYKDPLSGQTVSDPKGKTPDKFGTSSDLPIYLGFDSLLDNGFTLDQLNNLKTAFYAYSRQQSQPIKEVSMDVANISTGRSEKDPGLFYASFKIRMDRKKDYKAKVEYSGLEAVRLFLYDIKSGGQVYDSQIIDPTSGE